MKLQIHVHTPTFSANRSLHKDAPCVLIVREGAPGKILLCRGVRIDGPSTIVHGNKKRSVEGAHIWVETESPVYFKMKRLGEEKLFDETAPMKPSADVLAALKKLYPSC